MAVVAASPGSGVSLAQLPILKRLIPSLRKRWAWLSPPDKCRVVKRDGALFLVNYVGWADQMVVIHGLAERPQVEFLLQAIDARQCGVFMDIGAHMGVYSIMVARWAPRCTKIIAFEPDPRNFTHLLANLLVNGLTGKIETHAIAVSDCDGSVPFTQGPATHDVWSKVDIATAATMSVPSARLDTLLSLAGKSIAIKMDIEGHELQAIAGMRELLRKNRCFMQVESFAEQLPAFTAAMAELGYRRIHTIAHDHYFTNDP
jgi:FkbM family methyltransferase